jgi:hypothetical protein
MKRFCLFVLSSWLLLTAGLSFGQQTESATAAPATQQTSQPVHFYRLNFVIRERSENTLVSERSYSLGISAAVAAGGSGTGTTEGRDWWSLRSGTRVPAGSNYVDVGFNVDVRALDVGGALQLRLKADLSSLPPGEPATNSLPPIRQMRVEEAVLVPVGKPTLLYTGEDLNKHRFELEVTPVREK